MKIGQKLYSLRNYHRKVELTLTSKDQIYLFYTVGVNSLHEITLAETQTLCFISGLETVVFILLSNFGNCCWIVAKEY
jgi:hypothetical protein